MGTKTKIDWCDSTWNPVTGCLHGCEYCYARRIAERFSAEEKCLTFVGDTKFLSPYELEKLAEHKGKKEPYPFGFSPTLHKYRLDEPKKWEKPRTIFVCSMSDLFGEWVPDEWIKQVFEACEAAPQHRYIFLTKNPSRYMKMYNARIVCKWNEKNPEKQHKQTEEYKNTLPLPSHENWWFGSTLDGMESRRARLGYKDHTFVSIEPLMERMEVGLGSFGDDELVIIGAETGNRRGKVKPQREWVEEIVKAAKITGASVFMKESLRELMGDNFIQELPWEEKGDAHEK